MKTKKTNPKEKTTDLLKQTLSGRLHRKRQSIEPKRKDFTRGINTLIEAIENQLLDAPLAFESGQMRNCDVMSQVENLLNPHLDGGPV